MVWWDRHPDVLEREVAALEGSGLAHERDEGAFQQGVLKYAVTVQGPDGPITLHAIYPDEFPYFKPFVFTHDIGFDHHHNPTTGEVCLLDSSGAWLPSDTLAGIIASQWPKVLAANVPGQTVDDIAEVAQAEPVTAYLQTVPGAQLMIDSGVEIPADNHYGPAAVAIERLEPLLGSITSLGTPSSASAHAAGGSAFSAAWVRLTNVPAELSAEGIWKAATEARPSLVDEGWCSKGRNPSGKSTAYAPQMQVVVVAMPEEVAHREDGTGYVAVTRHRARPKKPASKPQLVKVVRAGEADVLQRAPELAQMRKKHVLVVGGGGIGSVVMLEMGRAFPSTATLLDDDDVEPAIAVRFPSAWRFRGEPKVNAVGTLIRESHPFTEVRPLDRFIGRARIAGTDQDHHELISAAVAEADIVMDATADTAIQHYLSDLARDLGRTYLQVEATRGAWAGLVAVYPAGSDLCWMCVQHYLTDHTIGPLPHNNAADIQPPGCAQPTYTGAGFDLATIAMHAVRVAIGQLTDDEGYGVMPGQLYTVALRTTDGHPVPATWTTHELGRHPKCQAH